MLPRIIRLTCFVMCLLMAVAMIGASAYAQDLASFDAQLGVWEQQLNAAERELMETVPDPEHLLTTADVLRKLRAQAVEQGQDAQEMLTARKQLLAALGEKPTEESGIKEDPVIATERETLNQAISNIDARIKQSQLVVSRADSLFDMLSKTQNAEKRQQLLERQPMLGTLRAVPLLYSEIVNMEGLPVSTRLIAGFGIFFTLISGIYLFRRNWLREILHSIPTGNDKPVSASIMYLALLSAALLLILRFNPPIVLALPYSSLLLAFSCGVVLALASALLLHRLRTLPQDVKQADGSIATSRPPLWNILLSAVRMVLLTSIPLAVMGYVSLNAFIALNTFLTLMVISFFFVMRRVLDWVYSHVLAKPGNVNGLSPLSISLLEPLLAVAGLLMVLHFWGINAFQPQEWLGRYREGFQIGTVKLNPNAILIGIAVFFVLFFLTRLLQWFLAERVFVYTSLTRGVKDAVLALSGYAGITIGILCALTTSGLDLSNLAIIAGALSVGIGFGLQAIFSNFVSGLILFFERPIKVGDWVIVGTQEGLVKKIRVRSTELETFQKASIVVPNSKFISETVTNWTLNDAMGRLEVKVGVVYNSDIELVRSLMLKIVSEHTEVRKRPEPIVLFMDFGDNALVFELRCFLKDVSNKSAVGSALRFAIFKAFRENGIEFPSQQRDLRIISPLPTDKGSDKGATPPAKKS